MGTALSSTEERLTLIYDAEVEEVFHSFLTPMFKIAGLRAEPLKILIVSTPLANAAALPGGVIVVNTGLIAKLPEVLQILGVLAHETGHVYGGHHARLEEAMRNTNIPLLMGVLLGGVALAGGSPDAAAAALFGSVHVAQRTLLAHSRGNESAADQAAVHILDQMQLSSRGLAESMQILAGEHFHIVSRQDGYALTHPLYPERINFFKNHLMHSPFAQAEAPAEWQEKWARVRLKLEAFLEKPEKSLQKYAQAETTAQKYALAIAYFKASDLPKALGMIDNLLALEPGNAFFHELKGQVLFENGRIAESIPCYRRAVEMRPESLLLRLQLGHALVEDSNPSSGREAEKHLKMVVERDSHNSIAWHFLAISHGKQGDMGKAALCIAEKALLESNHELAEKQAKRAQNYLIKGSPHWLRAQDILNASHAGRGLHHR